MIEAVVASEIAAVVGFVLLAIGFYLMGRNDERDGRAHPFAREKRHR